MDFKAACKRFDLIRNALPAFLITAFNDETKTDHFVGLNRL
jgi:hypothetical protein